MLADEFCERALVFFVPQDDKSNYRFSLIEITLNHEEGSSRVIQIDGCVAFDLPDLKDDPDCESSPTFYLYAIVDEQNSSEVLPTPHASQLFLLTRNVLTKPTVILTEECRHRCSSGLLKTRNNYVFDKKTHAENYK